MYKIVWFFLFMLLVSWVALSDSQAPEITALDVHGYDSYKAPEDDAICDSGGAVRGSILGNTEYDARWNTKYYIQGNRVYRVELEG
jgi:hypothetical protein